MNGVLVEVVRGQDRRQDGHLGLERGLDDTLQDGLGDELVPVDAAVDDEAAGTDRRVAAGLGEQRDLQAAGRREEFDVTSAMNAFLQWSRISVCQEAWT